MLLRKSRLCTPQFQQENENKKMHFVEREIKIQTTARKQKIDLMIAKKEKIGDFFLSQFNPGGLAKVSHSQLFETNGN